MKYQATKKVTGGKLIRVKINAPQNQIQSINIHGDFFLHPEDTLPKIEQTLSGAPTSSTPQELTQRIQDTLTKNNAAFVGITAEDLAQTIIEALTASS